MKENQEAYSLFKDFQGLQTSFATKNDGRPRNGQKKEAQQAQELSQKIQQDPIVSELMQKEQAFSLVANDLNRIIMVPCAGLIRSLSASLFVADLPQHQKSPRGVLTTEASDFVPILCQFTVL